MKNILFFLAATFSGLICFSCTKVIENVNPTPIPLTATEKRMAAEQNTFACNLFDALYQTKDYAGNVLVSPFSLQCALGMLQNGAEGETWEEIVQALQLEGYTPTEINDYFNKLVAGMSKIQPGITFRTANSIWSNQDIQMKKDFVHVNQSKYLAKVSSLDFSDISSLKKINDWCKKESEGMIAKAIDENQWTSSALMYLLKIVYFKAGWETKFQAKNTAESSFYAKDGTMKIPFMTNKLKDHGFFQNELFALSSLPYLNHAFSMRFILPNEDTPMGSVVEALAQKGYLESCLQKIERCNVVFKIPRFEIQMEHLDLEKSLHILNVKKIFSSEADFDKLADIKSYVSQIFQACRLKVDEEGSEGSAVTTIISDPTDIISPENPKEVTFCANRPFLFQIIENQTGAVLFMGKVESPEQ